MADQSRIDRFPQRRDDTDFINYISGSPIRPPLPSGPAEADLWAGLQSPRLSVRPSQEAGLSAFVWDCVNGDALLGGECALLFAWMSRVLGRLGHRILR